MIFYDYYSDVPKVVLQQFVTEQQLGRLVTVSDSGQPHIGLYPFLFLGATIEMHLHRKDEQLADLWTNSKSVFEVDEILGTIPSHWIHPTNAAFATAYYRSAIFECDASVSEDPKIIAEHQQRLMMHYQPEGGYETVNSQHAMYHGSLNTIAAITLTIRACKVKWKLAQNRDRETRAMIIQNLRERGQPTDAEAADALQWTLDHEASK
jgi:predicted FMN-binding regulatory protein PaiB